MNVAKIVHFALPYPHKISVNHCWQIRNKRVFLNPLVKQYRDEVFLRTRAVAFTMFHEEHLTVHIQMFPPDKRKRDIDNILKVVLDSLMHAAVFTDDHQIRKLIVEKMENVKYGSIEVSITEYEG